MSVLGIVVRTLPAQRAKVAARLAALPGCEMGPDPGDGRMVIVLESTEDTPAAVSMDTIARWPEVQSISLVYEHSDPDEDSGNQPYALDYRSWRSNVGAFARQQAAEAASGPTSFPPETIRADQGAGEL